MKRSWLFASILFFSFLFANFVFAADTGWVVIPTNVGSCTKNCGGIGQCFPSQYGVDYLELATQCSGTSSSYRFLCSSADCNLLNGMAVGKKLNIPSNGNYYIVARLYSAGDSLLPDLKAKVVTDGNFASGLASTWNNYPQRIKAPFSPFSVYKYCLFDSPSTYSLTTTNGVYVGLKTLANGDTYVSQHGSYHVSAIRASTTVPILGIYGEDLGGSNNNFFYCGNWTAIGAPNNPNSPVDNDGDNHTSIATGGDDCNDNNVNIHPGATEVCNGVDDNCNGQIDGGGVCLSGNTVTSATLVSLGSLTQLNSVDFGDTVLVKYMGSNMLNRIAVLKLQKNNGGNFADTSIPSSNFTWEAADGSYGYTPLNLDNSTLSVGDNVRTNVSDYLSSAYAVSNNVSLSATDDSRPIAQILTPANGSSYSTNTTINFTQNSSDVDDLLKIYWRFGDGSNADAPITTTYANSLNRSEGDTTHNYSAPGFYTVRLTALEATRDQSASDSSNIIVYQSGVNVMPVITSPLKNSTYGGCVLFNASQSYVVNCTAGNMPNKNFTTTDGALNCSYLHTPGTYIKQDLPGYSLLFNWSMGDGNSYTSYWNSTSFGQFNGAPWFSYCYSANSNYQINLQLTYNDSP